MLLKTTYGSTMMMSLPSLKVTVFFICLCVLKWSHLGVKKSLGHAQMVFFRGLIQNFQWTSPPLLYGNSPPPQTPLF